MGKRLRTTPIEATDLQKYLETESDFAFELSVVRILHNRGWKVEHGGTYSDPVTAVNRQFDIRAERRRAMPDFGNKGPSISWSTLYAIECKNLKPNYPLLVSTIMRPASECYLSVGLSDGGKNKNVIRLTDKCGYLQGEAVGKETAQVGLTEQNEIVSGDKEVYDKWSQAIASEIFPKAVDGRARFKRLFVHRRRTRRRRSGLVALYFR